MGFSYLSTAPASSDRSYVRLLVGDNSSSNFRLHDEELDALLTVEGDRDLAAAVAAETIGASFAKSVDRSVGRLRISMQQASQHHFDLAKRLRAKVALRAEPYVGGLSKADKREDETDTDRVEPGFTVGQFDVPGHTNRPWHEDEE